MGVLLPAGTVGSSRYPDSAPAATYCPMTTFSGFTGLMQRSTLTCVGHGERCVGERSVCLCLWWGGMASPCHSHPSLPPSLPPPFPPSSPPPSSPPPSLLPSPPPFPPTPHLGVAHVVRVDADRLLHGHEGEELHEVVLQQARGCKARKAWRRHGRRGPVRARSTSEGTPSG